MRSLPLAVALSATGLIAGPAMAAQPPMNNFNEAFYACDGGAFLMSYDSNRPDTATMTTSNNNKQYMLKRAPVAQGFQFTGAGVKFWTDGEKVTVEGTEQTYANCKMKAS